MQTVDFRFFPLVAGDVVLDLGCGEGRHVIGSYLQENVTAVGVDLSMRDLRTAQERFEPFFDAANTDKAFVLSRANALQLPFADQTFDKVICSEVLEHIPDYKAVLREIERVLKPGGLFCASVPRKWPEKICWWLSEGYYKVEGGHIRIFEARDLHRQIESLGFQSFCRHWAHALHSPFWWLKCLFWERRDSHWLIGQYHRMLVWDLMQRPALTRYLEKLLNPIMGKSIVMYFRKSSEVG